MKLRFGFLVPVLVFFGMGLQVKLRAESELVIYDNDWNAPGSYMEQNALMPLLASPRIKVIGLTSVTGDGWRDEGTANLLRYLEVIGEPSIPVYNGAVFPLINTRERMNLWEKTYGFVYWKGAWNDPARFPEAHPDDPYKIRPPRDRMPQIKAASGSAADFLIQAVHAYPHAVTIIAGGPLTNLAQAISLDPAFAGLAKELIFFGCGAEDLADVQTAGFHSDFNIIFDPEAAHIVLAAPWAKMTAVADVSNAYLLDQATMRRIQAHRSPAGDYLAQNSALGLPFWGEVMSAIVADPTLVTKSADVSMDVDIDHGMDYGRTEIGPLGARPRIGVGKVTIIEAIDGKRFIDELVGAIQTDVKGR